MEMQPVQSSNIKAIGHSGGAMRVQFANGKTYEYVGVMPALFDEFKASESPGKFFAARIRPVFDGVPVDGAGQASAAAPVVKIL